MYCQAFSVELLASSSVVACLSKPALFIFLYISFVIAVSHVVKLMPAY